MTDKHYAFVERKCNRCEGWGCVAFGFKCPECHGTGRIGSYEEVPNILLNGDREFGNLLRKTRERREISMSELTELLKCKVSRISEIECGIKMPTDKERKKLQEWIDGVQNV